MAASPKKRVTRLEAFTAYAAMPHDHRSVNALTKLLKERGCAISRNTLQDWCNEERWEIRVRQEQGAPLPEMGLAAAVAFRAAQEIGSGQDTLHEAMDNLALFTTKLTQHLGTFIAAQVPENLDDFIRLADATRFLVRTLAESKAALAAAVPANGDGARVLDAGPSGPSNADLAIASFR